MWGSPRIIVHVSSLLYYGLVIIAHLFTGAPMGCKQAVKDCRVGRVSGRVPVVVEGSGAGMVARAGRIHRGGLG